MMKIINVLFLLTLVSACIKTADQVNREKRFESMSAQMSDSQSLVANMVSQMKDIQTQLDALNGRLEELEHRQGKINPDSVKGMEETLTLLKSQQEADSAQLLAIQTELKEQRAFIEKVTESLNNLSKASAPSKKKSTKEEMREALALVRSNKYAEARKQLETFIDHQDLNAADHNKVLHGLGRVEYYTRNYEKALIYFSKIFTKYPRSSLAPSSLLFIGRSLEKTGKKDEAKEAYAKVTEDYPTSSAAKEAKKEL